MSSNEISELNKTLDIILSTIEYELDRTKTRFVIDKRDAFATRFEKLKKKAEKFHQVGKLDKLGKLLLEVTETAWISGDRKLSKYIQEKTGHSFDLFSNLPDRIAQVKKANKIRNMSEYRDVIAMIGIWRQAEPLNADLEILISLRDNYTMRKGLYNKESFDSVQILAISSPDNQKTILVYELEMKENRPITMVDLRIEKKGGCSLYAVYGKGLDISPSWKDDFSIVINTREYEVLTRVHEVQMLDQIIRVEYGGH